MKRKKTSFEAKRGTIFYFDPDDLVVITDKDHPLYDPRVGVELTADFVNSIKQRGVIEPVVIRKNGEVPEIVDGRQRVLAAREANRQLKAEGGTTLSIPAVQWRGDDGGAFETAILLNEQRRDDSVTEKAAKASALAQRGRTEEEIAATFGKSVSTVKAWLKLMDLHPKVQEAVDRGLVSASDAARKLGTLTREDQVKALADLSQNGHTVREAVTKHGGRAGAKMLPGKKLLRRLVDVNRENEGRDVLSKREIALLSFITGDLSEGKVGEVISGFLPLLRQAEKKPKVRKEEQP
jgi:ParB family chromosome partitioning protein